VSPTAELFERRSNQTSLPKVADTSVAEPSQHVCVLTCMDARIDVADVLALQPGEVHILRNAGGVVTDDVIRSVALSQRHLSTTELLIMQHTTCGLTGVSEQSFKEELENATGLRPNWSVEAFNDVYASVRQQIERARRNPFLLHHDQVRGFVYDVHTGEVTEVDAATVS